MLQALINFVVPSWRDYRWWRFSGVSYNSHILFFQGLSYFWFHMSLLFGRRHRFWKILWDLIILLVRQGLGGRDLNSWGFYYGRDCSWCEVRVFSLTMPAPAGGWGGRWSSLLPGPETRVRSQKKPRSVARARNKTQTRFSISQVQKESRAERCS